MRIAYAIKVKFTLFLAKSNKRAIMIIKISQKDCDITCTLDEGVPRSYIYSGPVYIWVALALISCNAKRYLTSQNYELFQVQLNSKYS